MTTVAFTSTESPQANPLLLAFRGKASRGALSPEEHIADGLLALEQGEDYMAAILKRDGIAVPLITQHLEHARRVLTRLQTLHEEPRRKLLAPEPLGTEGSFTIATPPFPAAYRHRVFSWGLVRMLGFFIVAGLAGAWVVDSSLAGDIWRAIPGGILTAVFLGLGVLLYWSYAERQETNYIYRAVIPFMKAHVQQQVHDGLVARGFTDHNGKNSWLLDEILLSSASSLYEQAHRATRKVKYPKNSTGAWMRAYIPTPDGRFVDSLTAYSYELHPLSPTAIEVRYEVVATSN
jgi:hypothetical protein